MKTPSPLQPDVRNLLDEIQTRLQKLLQDTEAFAQQEGLPVVALPEVAPRPPLTIAIDPAAQLAFMRALAGVKTVQEGRPDWWIKVALRKWNYACAYCGRSITENDRKRHNHEGQPTVDHLIPLTVGGPHHHDAVVACCLACNASKGRLDWLTWDKAVDKKAIRELRAKLSRESWNHLAPDPVKVKTKLKVERMLAARWEHPRFLCHASITSGGAFIGVANTLHAPREFSWILRHHGGKPVQHERTASTPHLSVFSFDQPAQALDATWALIERNALVRRLDLSPEFADATPRDREALAMWPYSFPNVGNLVKRRWDKPNGFRGHSQAWREGRVSKGTDGRWVIRD